MAKKSRNKSIPAKQAQPGTPRSIQIEPAKFDHKRALNPVLWFDHMRMTGMSTRDEGGAEVVILIPEAVIPDAKIVQEVARLITSVEHAKKIVDLMCRNLNYYPQPQDSAENKAP